MPASSSPARPTALGLALALLRRQEQTMPSQSALRLVDAIAEEAEHATVHDSLRSQAAFVRALVDEIARRVTGGMVEKTTLSGQYAPRPDADADKMYSDYLAELTPAGQTVWEWRTWEHLDPEADGIAEVQAPRKLWAQGNSVQELPDGDILASYRPTSTVVRISRQTGEILWKLGPPTVAGQHAPTLLGNGNVLIFDNGVHRLDDSVPYSRVIEINPATNEIVWKYQDKPTWNFFSPRMGNAQRLPNGNTLITESSFGRFFEVTNEGEIVWEYVNPFFGKPFFGGPASSESNQVFRALRYSAEEITRARGLG